MAEGLCTEPPALYARLRSLFAEVKTSGGHQGPNALNILMTAYMMPKSAPTSDCLTPAKVFPLNAAIKAACDAESVCTFISANDVAGAGGSNT